VLTQRSDLTIAPARITGGVERGRTRHRPLAEPASRAADDGSEVFAPLRRRLFGIAYRVLGRWAEAEDVVQDVWVRWQRYDRGAILNPTAFLVTATTRLAINATQTARVRRETSVGDWSPECTDSGGDPASEVVNAEDLECGIHLLLERLSPTERAAFVLREAFDYPYATIADLLELTEVNARQLVSRAGKSLARGRQATVGAAERRQLTNAIVAASRRGDLVELEALVVRGRHRLVERSTGLRAEDPS
jgi:RNA polymerase sigma-70 factor (ECF subfamily)